MYELVRRFVADAENLFREVFSVAGNHNRFGGVDENFMMVERNPVAGTEPAVELAVDRQVLMVEGNVCILARIEAVDGAIGRILDRLRKLLAHAVAIRDDDFMSVDERRLPTLQGVMHRGIAALQREAGEEKRCESAGQSEASRAL